VLRGREGLIRLWGCAAEMTDGARTMEALPPGLAAGQPEGQGVQSAAAVAPLR